MARPDKPVNEEKRLETLWDLNILDTDAEERYDRVTRLARRLFNVPIAQISLIDEERQWFKSCVGIEATQTPRDISFCGHAILGEDTGGKGHFTWVTGKTDVHTAVVQLS